MIIRFNILGQTLQFDDSIKIYRNVVCECQNHVEKVWSIYNRYTVNSDSNLKELVAAIQDMSIAIMDNHIKPHMNPPKIESFDSEEEFMVAAKNFSTIEQYLNLYKLFDSALADIITRRYDAEAQWAQSSNAQLQREIDKIVKEHEADAAQGLGFGILSSSFLAHILYDLFSVNRTQKIGKECNKVIEDLKNKQKNVIKNHQASTEGLMWRDFSQHVEKILNQIQLTSLLVLEKWQVISPNLNRQLNECKALDIVKTVPYAVDKEAAILDALALCPYSTTVWEVARNEQLIDDGFEALIQFFN